MPKAQKNRKYKPRPPVVPKLRHHKASDQGLVVLNGRSVYLGRFDLPATKQRYDAVIAGFLANNRTLPPSRISYDDAKTSVSKITGPHPRKLTHGFL